MVLNIIIDVKPVKATEINNNALTGNKWSDIFIHNELGKGFVCLYVPSQMSVTGFLRKFPSVFWL